MHATLSEYTILRIWALTFYYFIRKLELIIYFPSTGTRNDYKHSITFKSGQGEWVKLDEPSVRVEVNLSMHTTLSKTVTSI